MPDNNKPNLNVTVNPEEILKTKGSGFDLKTGEKGYFGRTGFGESKYDLPQETSWADIESGNLEELRAQRQSSLAKIGSGLANAVTQTGLDIAKDTSYLLDYRNYTDFTERAKEGFHNDIADAIQSAEDKLKLPVYRTKESEGFSPLSAGWWGENIPSILSTVSMMVPAQGAVMGLSKLGKALGGAKLIRGIEAVSGTKNLSAGLKGITGAGISRGMESIMEGSQTFEDTYKSLEGKKNPKTNEFFTEEEKKAIAGEAAANNYKLNWANIVTDLPQYMLLNKSFSQMIKDQRIGLSDLAATMGQESGEEAYQFITNEETKRAALIKSGVLEDDKSSLTDRVLDYAKDGEFWTSAFLGGLGGGIFTGVGKLSENKNIEKLQKQQEAIVKLHTAVIKGDEQSFNRTTDDVFHGTLMDNITDLDNFKSMLEMTPEAMDDPEERVKSQKTLNDRKQVIKFAEDYKNTLAADNTKDDALKATELDIAVDQKLTDSRLRNINTELTSLKAEDAYSLNLQDPTLYQFKNLKMQYEAIKDIPQLADKAKQLQTTIAENYNLLLSEGLYSSKEDIDKQLISPNDSKIINLIRNQELDSRRFNQNKEVLYQLSTPEGRDNIKKAAEDQIAKQQEAIRVANEQAAKAEQDKIIDIFANKINSGEELQAEDELAYYNANKKAIDSRVEQLKTAGNNVPQDILDILNKDVENEANFEQQKAEVISQPVGDIFGDVSEPTETDVNADAIADVERRRQEELDKTSTFEEADIVNVKYDAELAALESKPKVATLESELQDLNNKKEKAISDLTNANLPQEVLQNATNVINERFNNLESLVKQKYGVKEDLNKQIEKIEDAQNTKENIIVNANDGIVPEIGYKERKALENELSETLEFTNDQGESVSPQGNVVTLGDLIINAAKSIAYLSKSYIAKIAKLGEVTYSQKEDISEDELNEFMQEPMLLSNKQYQVGEELSLSVDTTFSVTKEDGTVISYEQTKDNPYLVPIKITNKEGKIIGYLHTLDWINESNVASKNDNIEKQRNALKALREDIVAKGTKKVIISNKTLGKLNFTAKKADKPTSEVIKNPNTKFVIGKNNSFYEGLDMPLNGNQPINRDVKAGLVYMLVDTPVAGKTIAIPVFNNKVSDEIADTLTNAVEAFFKQDTKIADNILKQTGIDILKINGLRNFFELYVATASFDQSDLNNNVGNDDKLFLNVLGSGIQYGTGGDRIKSVGNLQNFNREDFNRNIKKAYTSIFLKHLNKPLFKQVYIDNKGKVTYKESTYNEFIKNNTTTNVSDIKLPDGSYTLFVQPVITFDELIAAKDNILNDSSKPSYVTPSTKSNPTRLGEINFDALNDEEDLVDESPVVLGADYSSQPVKEGVEELFDSNPELANKVYEALGFDTSLPTIDNIIETDNKEEKKEKLNKRREIVLKEINAIEELIRTNPDKITIYYTALYENDYQQTKYFDKSNWEQSTEKYKSSKVISKPSYLHSHLDEELQKRIKNLQVINSSLYSNIEEVNYSNIFQIGKNYSSLEILKYISNNKKDVLSSIAEKLLKYSEKNNVEVSILEKGEKSSVAGLYSSLKNKIEIYGKKSITSHTLIHEIVHSLSVIDINLNPDSKQVKSLNNILKNILDKRILKEYENFESSYEDYATKNIKELLSEIISRPDILSHLALYDTNYNLITSKYKKETLLDEIIKIISDIFNFTKRESETLADAILLNAVEIFKNSRTTSNYKSTLITPQQKQQALQAYSQYLDAGNQGVEGFKRFIDSVDLTPVTLTEQGKKEIADSSSLIPGFNAFRQGQVVNIMNGFILKSLKEKGAQTKSALYNELKNEFVQYEQAFRDRNKVNYANEFKKILDNYEEFVKQSEQRLKLFNVKEMPSDPNKISNEGKPTETPVEDVVGVENVESNNEKVNFDDGATFMIDSKDSMSSRLKQFLSFITSPTKSYLGLDTYMPFDEVVNYLSGQLAGIEASYADISARLDEVAKIKPWIATVKQELDNASEEIRNEFVQWATKHYTNFKIAEIFGSIKTGISVKVMDSDQNAIIKTIQSKWLANLKTTDLVKETTPGNLVIDNSKRKALVDELNSIDKNDLNAVREWLNKIGIEVSMDTLEAVKNNTKFPYAKQFTDKNGIFFNITANLAKETLSTEDSFDTNNPLSNNSGIRKLAAIEALYSDAHFSNSFKNGEGKSIFAYSNNKYFINQFYKLKRNVGNYLNNLLSTSFASTSSWGKQLKNKDSYFSQVFDYFYLDTLKYKKDGVTLDKMSSREHELTKLGLFWNQNNGRNEQKISHFLFPTMSDKSTMTGVTALRHNVEIMFNEDGSIELSNNTKDALYDIAEAEYKRILQSYNINNDIDGYNPNMFYFFEELNNNKALWEEVTTTDANGKEVTRKTLKPLNQINQDIVKDIVSNHVLKLIEAKKQHWMDLGLTTKDSFKFADKTYLTDARNNLREVNKNMNDVITYMAADYVTNYVIANANSFQLFVGDPAQFYKKSIEDTWINVGKRLAAEIAPGLELADSKDNKFTTAFAKDASGALGVSMNFPQLLKILDGLSMEQFDKLTKNEKKALNSYPYYEIEGTDAQEYTTLKEHLYVLEKSGKISPDKVKELLEREEKGTLNKYDFNDIFQPIKPVYVNTQLEPSMDVNRKIYIKSSSFPLVKGLTPQMDKLRNAMIKNNVDRLAFKTATKVGGPKDFIDIFNQDGSVKDNLVFDNKILLDRSGFRIQQDVPFDIEKDAVNRGSQEAKLLFANILDMPGFNYNGKEMNGKELQDEYNALNKQLFANGKAALLEEITDENGNLKLEKVQALLVEEAKGRGWPQNDIDALKLVKVSEVLSQFAMPLWASTSANKIEALLSSLVDNRVRKQKLRGNSFVLGSEEGFRGRSKDIIYTKSYNPETGLLPMRIGKDGKVLPAQILITNKLKDQEGNPVNLQRFMTRDGFLDLSKIDPELLKGFGFRIPTQLHSSMSYVEVVGFLPSYMGDLVIAPKDFTKQMGSDFDVDKLYTYMYNAKIENGRLVKDDSSSKKKLQNELLDVHISVMSNPKLFPSIVKALGFGELPSISERVDAARNKRFKSKFKPSKLSDTYQKEKYLKARAGKSGTGVKSLDSVFTAISQGKGLYLRTVTGGLNPVETKLNLVFGDESGKPIELNDISSKDGVNNQPKINSVSAYQSAAVDNEKEQILEKVNSNNYTFDAERALAAVGFDESFVAPLTSQDIIFEYTSEMARSQDSVNDEFISNPEQTIVNKLIQSYAEKGNISKEAVEKLMNPDYPLTKEEMWTSIEMGEKDPNYYNTQIRALVKFNKAREIGKEISNIQLTINTDSAGVSPSLIESNYKEEKVDQLYDNKYIANVEKLLENTINGFATNDALKLNNSLWYNLFPYGKISQVFNELQSVLGKKVLTNEKRLKIFNGIKSFVYSKRSLGLDNENVKTLREKLFFDRGNNKSLASQVKELQKTSKNPFISRLTVEIDPTGAKPSLIKYNAGAAENFDELNVYQGFIDLIGNSMTTELAQNMITYFYLSGGIQQAIQFGKYIPNSYLRAIGFDENLRNLNFEDPELLGILDLNQKSNYYEVSNFVKQYIQHNPGETIRLKEDLSQIDPKSIKRDFNKTITEFTTTNKLASDILVGRVMPETNEFLEVLPEFVNLDFKLYQYTGNGKYVLIDTLGSFGYSEYNQGKFNVDSLVYENKANKPLPKQPVKTDTRDVVEKEMPGVANNLSDTRRVIKYNIVNIDNALDIIFKKSTNLLHKALAPEIRRALKNSPKINIAISNDPATKGAYYYNYGNKEGTLVVNETNTRSDEDFERTLLHELIHHLTGYIAKAYDRYLETEGQDRGDLTDEQIRICNSLKTMQNTLVAKIKSNPEWQAQYNKFVEKYESKKHVDEIQVSKNYGAYKFSEFFTMTMTDMEFQKILNDIPFDSNKTMLDRFVELVNKLLGSVGFPVKENSVLSNAVSNIVELINLTNPEYAEELSESAFENNLSENIKNFVNSIIPNWINNKNNELSLASEFKSMQLLDEEESPIEDRILFGKQAEKLIKEGLKGKNPFQNVTFESQIPNLLYAVISGKLAEDGISEKDMFNNIFSVKQQLSIQEDIFGDVSDETQDVDLIPKSKKGELIQLKPCM